MHNLQLYEYAVIRIVPRVEREEFMNAGLIVFCKKTGYLGCRISLNKQKIICFDEKVDLEFIEANLNAFEKIALGDTRTNSPIAQLDPASRFRCLTATRSTIIQCSKVHPGLTGNLEAATEKLMKELVL